MRLNRLHWLLLCIIVLGVALWFGIHWKKVTSGPTVAADKVPNGWLKRGTTPDYEVGVDDTIHIKGTHSAYLKTSAMPENKFATLMQSFRADDYRGKRVRLSAQVRVQGDTGQSALWMRVDSDSRTESFDNMFGRETRSPSDWKEQVIVLDVPPESVNISFGVIFVGKGQTWVDDFQIDVVGKEIPVTQPSKPTPRATRVVPATEMKPVNLDFED